MAQVFCWHWLREENGKTEWPHNPQFLNNKTKIEKLWSRICELLPQLHAQSPDCSLILLEFLLVIFYPGFSSVCSTSLHSYSKISALETIRQLLEVLLEKKNNFNLIFVLFHITHHCLPLNIYQYTLKYKNFVNLVWNKDSLNTGFIQCLPTTFWFLKKSDYLKVIYFILKN